VERSFGSVNRVLADADVTRILVITAHPDDVDFGVAGSVARWTSEGADVAYCVVTDGDAGGFDEDFPRADVPALRRAEQVDAARVVGVTDVTFLGYPDGRLETTIALRRDLSRVIRRVRPHRVVCQSPQRLWTRLFASHPDHLAAGEAALCAVYPDSRNPFAHPELAAEGFEAWTVDQVWLMAHESANRYVDVTATVDRKVKALLCHVSQMREPDAMEEWIRAWTADTAAQGGLPAGALAEAFFAIDTAG
jgi:LmbE family N-acetylglucosaminyl deacetylase